MERTYTVTLALVAWVTTLVIGWSSGGGIAEVLWTAWYALLMFAVIGYVVGTIAAQIVDEAVRSQLTTRIDESAKAKNGTDKKSAAA